MATSVDTVKQCSSCGDTKPLDEFCARSDSLDGRRGSCRACLAAYKARQYQSNKARLRERLRKNSDYVNSRRRERYCANHEKNRDHKNAMNRKWYQDNIEENRKRHSARQSALRRASPEPYRSRVRNRRALLRASQGQHTAADIHRLLLAANGKCYWCGDDFDDDLEVDHVWPVALGGENHVGNLCLSCGDCNKKKGAKSPQEFAGVLL